MLAASRMPAKPSRRNQYKFSFWTFLIGLGVIISMVGLNWLHVFDRYEASISDRRMYWRSTNKPPEAIKIAAIDDKSIAELGQWPFPRNVMAQFERELT